MMGREGVDFECYGDVERGCGLSGKEGRVCALCVSRCILICCLTCNSLPYAMQYCVCIQPHVIITIALPEGERVLDGVVGRRDGVERRDGVGGGVHTLSSSPSLHHSQSTQE